MAMGYKKIGRQSIQFEHPPVIANTYAIVGPKEGQGPLGDRFDQVLQDNYYGEKDWERAEIKMLRDTITNVISQAMLKPQDVDFLIAGDLLNQNIASNFAVRDIAVPFLGLYNACATFVESITLGAILIDSGYAKNVVAAASSHYSTAERQYRFPTEFGVQRKPTSQWTVTGAGAACLKDDAVGPRVTAATVGIVNDMGEKDPYNMGTAMAPAAADTIQKHLTELSRSPDYYDLYLGGDLGKVGIAIVNTLLSQKNVKIADKLVCCGMMMYNDKQGVHAGGSGAGCTASVFSGHIFKEMKAQRLKKVLLVGTGALFSPLTYQQGESIPAVAHAVAVEL